MKTQIETKKDTYVVDYPQAVQAAQEQTKIIWFAEELGVEKDENDIRTKCTEGNVTASQLYLSCSLNMS